MSNTRRWVLLSALAVVAVLAIGWIFVVSPVRGEAAELRAQTDGQRQTNSDLEARIAMLAEQAEQLPEQEERLREISRRLPPDPDLATLIRRVQNVARRAGVEFVAVEPTTPAPLLAALPDGTQVGGAAAGVPAPPPPATPPPATPAPGDPADPAASSVDSAAELVYYIPLQIRVTGKFFAIERFFNELEDLRRAFLVTGFTIEPADTTQAADTPDAVDAPTESVDAVVEELDADTLTATIDARVFMAPVSIGVMDGTTPNGTAPEGAAPESTGDSATPGPGASEPPPDPSGPVTPTPVGPNRQGD
ncbi:MAG: type 4a pilus biogenesis protein PilO [Actinomycetota bacterium]|nr:type 4a pilus biogenesis protein PilO [Actinomycetota bacterium]